MRIHYLFILLLLVAQQAIAVVTVQDQVDDPCAGMYEGYSYLEADMCWQDLRHAPIDSIAQYIAQHPFHNDTTQLAALVYLMNDAYMNNNKERMDQYRSPLKQAAQRINQPLYIHRLRLMDIARGYTTYSLQDQESVLSELEVLYQYFISTEDQLVFEEMSDYAFTTLNAINRINEGVGNKEASRIALDRCTERLNEIKDPLLYHYLQIVIASMTNPNYSELSLEIYQNQDYHYQKMVELIRVQYPNLYCDARVRKISMLKYMAYLDQYMGFIYLHNGAYHKVNEVLSRMKTYPNLYAEPFVNRLRDKCDFYKKDEVIDLSEKDEQCTLNQYSSVYEFEYSSVDCIKSMVDTLSQFNTGVSIYALIQVVDYSLREGDPSDFERNIIKLDSISKVRKIEDIQEYVKLTKLAKSIRATPDIKHIKQVEEVRSYFQNNSHSHWFRYGFGVRWANVLISELYDIFGLEERKEYIDSIRFCVDEVDSNKLRDKNYAFIKSIRCQMLHGDVDEELYASLLNAYYLRKELYFFEGQRVASVYRYRYKQKCHSVFLLAQLALKYDDLPIAEKLLKELVDFQTTYLPNHYSADILTANIAEYKGDYKLAIKIYENQLENALKKNSLLNTKDLSSKLIDLYNKTQSWEQLARVDHITDSLNQIIQQNVIEAALIQSEADSNHESTNSSKWYCLLLLIPILIYLLRSFPQWFVDKYYSMRLKQEGERKERKRISSKLHDSVGSSLTGLKLKVEQQLKEGNRSPEMEELLSHLSRIHKEVREISHALKDPDFENNRLDALVHYFMDIMSKQKEIKITKSIYGEENLDQLSVEATTALYRCVQELVNNAMKHAAASEISVSLTSSPDSLILIVEDDGLGMTAEQYQQATKKGIGLATCRDRCRELGAQMEIDSRLGRGTIITIILKLIK